MSGQFKTRDEIQSEVERLKAEVFKSVTADLLKLLIPFGIQFDEATELLGESFLEAVESQLIDDGQKPSKSAIALRSGVYRKKVAAWMERTKQEKSDGHEIGVHARILNEWFENPKFLDSQGAPKLLTKSGPGVSFFDLVDSCTSDVYAGGVLNDLLHHDVVTKTGDWLQVKNRHFITKTHSLESLNFAMHSLKNLLETNRYNVNKKAIEETGRLNKIAHGRVPVSQVIEKENLINQKVNDLLTIISQELEFSSADLGDEPSVEMGLGVYGFINEESTPD